MLRYPRLGRLFVAAALVVSGSVFATLVSTAPASAANTNVTATCGGPSPAQSINNGDTITFTVGTGCSVVLFGMGSSGTAVWTPSFSLNPGAPVGGLSQGDTVVYTAPATGSGTAFVSFGTSIQFPQSVTFNITYPMPTPRSDTLTDNGDGTMTVTYGAVTSPDSVFVSLFPTGTTCEQSVTPASFASRLYVVSTATNPPTLTAGRTVLAVGSPALAGAPPNMTPSTIAAGSYQACLYYYSGQNSMLEQSMAITLGAAATTTTTAGTSADPVAPAFTG